MSITLTLIRGIACLLPLANIRLAQSMTTSRCSAVPHFPQWPGQTAIQVDGAFSFPCDHPLKVATDINGSFELYDLAKHGNWTVKENHKMYPPQKPLAPGEAVGVVFIPVFIDPDILNVLKFVVYVVVGVLIGLAVGFMLWHK